MILIKWLKSYLAFLGTGLIEKMEEKQIAIIIFSFMITQQILGFISNTGAFEVYCNDILIFSKIASHGYPTMDNLLQNMKQNGISYT